MTSAKLSLDSPLADVDARVANRKMGRKTGRPASQVLADQFGIETVGQLLRHYPRRYIDRSNTVPIRAVRMVRATQPTLAVAGSEADKRRISIGQWVTVIATVHSTRQRWTRNRQQMMTVTIDDGTAKLDLPFFNQPWLANQFQKGLEVAVSAGLACTGGTCSSNSRRSRSSAATKPTPCTPAASSPCIARPRASRRARSASSSTARCSNWGPSTIRCRSTSWPARTCSTRTPRSAGSTSRPTAANRSPRSTG